MGSVLLRRMSKHTKYVEATTETVIHEVRTSPARARSSPGLRGARLPGCGWSPPHSRLRPPPRMLHVALLQGGTGLPVSIPSHSLFPQAQKTSVLWKPEQCCKTR